MKKHLLLAILVLLGVAGMAQDKCYWVFFTDKNDTQFDPYTYFDAKAIARYEQCGADLYDISNYPLNDSYVNTVDGYATELFGQSRWLNAVGIMTTDDNAMHISALPFVDRIQEIASFGIPASMEADELSDAVILKDDDSSPEILSDQLKRFGGQYFVDKGIDGKGIRICVMDGGFPKVDTHPAFKNLRDNHQILKTWNFANNIENVYGWNSHGTMVLSCIAGIDNKGQKLGLATGSEFLLARTEINPEPFKEEVWWAQAAEWADKNGADIISSSLGYAKDRYWTKDMDGNSYVAKAAQKAVEKGILVCNSAGNCGSDKRWMTIVTPSDAENVLCVGGIEPSLTNYSHIDFSSYGPTADKRMKPNVVAFGKATVAYSIKEVFADASGTSFSCPLTAGFCACAWQTHRDLTAMQLKTEIEKSADLYPYYDYAFGYGVPQAAYFTGDLKPAKKSFDLVQEKDGVRIVIPELIENQDVFFNVEGSDGVLLGYYKTRPGKEDIILKNTELGQGVKLNVSYNGYYQTCPIKGTGEEICLNANSDKDFTGNDGTFQIVKEEGFENGTYMRFDYNFGNNVWNGFNYHFGFGERIMYGKSYKIGFGIGYDHKRFISKDLDINNDGIRNETQILQHQLLLELFQRVIIQRWDVIWDLGGYLDINESRNVKTVNTNLWYDNNGQPMNPQPYEEVESVYKGSKSMNRAEYGITTRISYKVMHLFNVGLYGSYRLSDILIHDDPVLGPTTNEPSPWRIGIDLEFGN